MTRADPLALMLTAARGRAQGTREADGAVWRRVAELAVAHGLEAAVASAWRAAPSRDRDASGAAAYLRTRLRDLEVRALLQRRDLDDIAAAARTARAPALLLKGAAFAGWLYDAPALRPRSDTDVLVPPAHGVPVVRALLDAGWTRAGAGSLALGAPALRSPRGTSVDVHTAFSDAPGRAALDGEPVWERARPLPAHEGLHTLHVIDHAIHVCEHAARNGWVRLGWAEDLRRLLAQPDCREVALRERARRLGRQRVLALGSWAVDRLTGHAGARPGIEGLRVVRTRRWRDLLAAIEARWAAPETARPHRSDLAALRVWSERPSDTARAHAERAARALRRRWTARATRTMAPS